MKTYKGKAPNIPTKLPVEILNRIILIHVPCSFIILYYDKQMHIFFHKLSHSYMFRNYRAILRELIINNLPRYTSISNTVLGNTFYN